MSGNGTVGNMNTQRAPRGDEIRHGGEKTSIEDFELFDVARYKAPLTQRLGEAALQTQEAGRNSQSTHKVPLEINHARVEAVLGALMSAYVNNEYPYNLDAVRLPHDPRHMPRTLKPGSRNLEDKEGKTRAMFFWNVCYYMRGGIKSNDAVIRLGQMYDEHPELFSCACIVDKTQDGGEDILKHEIRTTLQKVGLGFREAVSRQWVENALRMQAQYDGDPRRIFEDVSSYAACLDRIQNKHGGTGFIGFQEKMVSMITYYLMDDGLIDEFVFPIPVDFHVARISIANELVSFPDVPHGTDLYSRTLLDTLRGIYFEYAHEHGVSPLRLCDAVWLLSVALCGKQPGNVTFEPNGRNNRTGRKTLLVPQIADPSNELHREAYAETCAKCPIEQHCQFNIPGADYYIAGSLNIRGVRIKLPEPSQAVLF